MDKWIFVNNITSFEKLYILTKAVKEKEITINNHKEELMKSLNESGANRNEMNNHPLNFILFYNMIYLDNEVYKVSNNGDFLLENYNLLNDDQKLKAEFFFNVLCEIKYPNDAVKTSDAYDVFPFKILFKLLFDNKINRKFKVEEVENSLSLVKNMSDYNIILEEILKFRNSEENIFSNKVEQFDTVSSAWIKQFNVMKKEGDYIMISDDLNLNIPEFMGERKQNKNPFDLKFCKFVLENYLFENTSMINIEKKYYNDEERRGFLVKEVLDYFMINIEGNKNIYHGYNFVTVINFLKLQDNDNCKIIANVLEGNEDNGNPDYIFHEESLTEEELVVILNDYKTKYGVVAGIHLFGIEFSEQIKNYNKSDIIRKAGLNNSFKAELQKGIKLSKYVAKYANPISSVSSETDDELLIKDDNRVQGAFNKIYYGVPGSGKSYIVENEFSKQDYHKIRTTFHPEYTNSDFIGQIIPGIKDEKVSYDFQAGAFTEALEYALLNETEKVVLVIEEINRGNASAIFGDIFQLLDRKNDEKSDAGHLGESKYKIFNGAIKNYFIDKGIEFDKVYIPSNLWIIGTMNTSDQNVFTLDTAFKRRWKMQYIKNQFANNDKSKELANTKLPYDKEYGITWLQFVTMINKKIIENNNGINGEDKQLGVYFVSLEELNNDKEFAEKILSYLWEDVAKLNVDEWFSEVSSYDELLNKYKSENIRVFGIFDELINEARLERPDSNVINIGQPNYEEYNN